MFRMHAAVLVVSAAALTGAAVTAAAQGWSPGKNVEIVVPNPPGGSNDKTARSLERILIGATRAIFAPKGLTPQQSAYWEGMLRKVTEAADWKEELEKNIWSNEFVAGAKFARDLEQDYAAMKAVLVDLGLAK